MKMTAQQRVLAAFGILVILGGGNAVAVRFTALEMPPFWGAILRFGPSAAIFWMMLAWKKIPLPKGKALEGAILFGLLSVGGFYALFYYGSVEVQAGLSTILLALVPLFTFFFAVLKRQESFRWRGLLGSLISLTGIYLAVGGAISARAPVPNLLAVVGAAALMALASVLYKSYPQNHPLVTNTIAVSSGLIALIVISLVRGESWAMPLRSESWLALAYVIFIGTVFLFFLYFYILDRWTASATSYNFLLVPITAVIFSSWLEGEHITGGFLLGGALVLLGVWVGVFSED